MILNIRRQKLLQKLLPRENHRRMSAFYLVGEGGVRCTENVDFREYLVNILFLGGFWWHYFSATRTHRVVKNIQSNSRLYGKQHSNVSINQEGRKSKLLEGHVVG